MLQQAERKHRNEKSPRKRTYHNGYGRLHQTDGQRARNSGNNVRKTHAYIGLAYLLGVDREIAVSDACKMEHSISGQSFSALKKHIEEWKRGIYKVKSDK